MSGDESSGRIRRRSRQITRPQIPPGPLRELKNLLYELYLEAGTPDPDVVAAGIAADDGLPGAPERDTVRRILASAEVPPSQADLTAVITLLARLARRDPGDATGRGRELWMRSHLAAPAGLPIRSLTDPFALKVHRAIDAGAAGRADLPAYVPRHHDGRLAAVVRRAVSGHSAVAMLVGGSSTGKTRTCWEAVRILPSGWRLWHPTGPDRSEAIVAALASVAPRTVIWLDESQSYLLTPAGGLGERVAAGLRALVSDPERGPVLVLGTVRPEYWAALTGVPAAGGPTDRHPQARALVSGTGIGVPDGFTGSALAAARAAAGGDPRLKRACAESRDGRITQYLAGVPGLVRRYRDAPAPARALIEAAMDARRVGHGPELPHTLLRAAETGNTDALWRTAELLERTGRTEEALAAYRRAAETGNTDALWRTVELLERTGRTDEAVTWLRARAEGGDTDALWKAVELLRESGRTEEAVTWLRARAGNGDTGALQRFAVLLYQLGRAGEAVTWLRARAETGDAAALEHAVDLMYETGRAEEAITWLDARVEAGDIGALKWVAALRCETGHVEQAVTTYLRAAELGLPGALRQAIALLRRLGRVGEAERLRRYGITPGGT